MVDRFGRGVDFNEALFDQGQGGSVEEVWRFYEVIIGDGFRVHWLSSG